jgi:methanogenic corrinoid protein MtbC1
MGHRRENDPHGSREAKITELAGAFAEALLTGNEVAAEVAIRQAMDVKLTTAQIDERLIAPALWLVGELWERGMITVAEEHIASEIAIRVLALQREARRLERARSDRTVMLATPAGELHVIALRMVENLLRGAGYDVVMLGPDVPAHALGAAAQRHEVDVVCISSTMPARIDEVLTAIDEIQQQRPSAGFVVGGQGLTVEDTWRPQVQVCQRVSEAIEAVDALVKRAGLN